MNEFILNYEPIIRLIAFVGLFGLFALGEILRPRRQLTQGKTGRWASNIGILIVDALVLRLVFPAAAVGVAGFVQLQGWGLFAYYPLPPAVMIIISVLCLDMVVYLQHVMFHAVPMFWRFHRVHHADLDFDVTTGLRFHPIEILLSMGIKAGAIIILGMPVVSVILFEILLNGTSIFNHSNIHIPKVFDRWLRVFIVTPDMHRVHHSIITRETNSNFGFNLSCWDRLFGTYRDQPRLGHRDMTIGLYNERNPQRAIRLLGMLKLPFLKDQSYYPINRR